MRFQYADTELLKKARERFKLADDADSEQQKRERDDIAFEAGQQWPADIQLARQGQQPTNGMPAVPARPTLVINKVKEPVRQILNQERASDIGIELVPADDFGDLGLIPDDTEITLREGLVRRIQRESIAADARTWAFKRAVIAGRGYYLVMTRFLPGKTWDQEVYVHRIYNQAGVLLDPSHEQPDGSDADWEFMGTWVPWDRYKAEYPVLADGSPNPFSEASEADFMSMAEDYPDWYQADGDERAVRVMDYWYTDREARDLAILGDGTAVWADEVPDGAASVDTRTVIQKTIRFCKIGGGVQELEKTDWAGPDMPIIKVLGDEVLPFDGKRRAEGMVRPTRDSQMGFNYMVSKQVEVIGLTPIPPLHVDPDAIDGYESWYAVANTRTLPYLPSRTYDDQGRQLQEPHRTNVDPNILPIAQSIGLFDASIKSTTAVPDPTLGNVDPSLKSGRAIREVVANAALSTSNFLDNLARSIRYEGQVINGLLYPIYGARPGRLVRVLTGEGEHQAMVVGDPQDPQAQQRRQRAAGAAKLTKDAQFNVLVKVTKSFDSRRTQEATVISELLSAQPELMTWFGDLFFKNQDGPGHMEMSERAKVMLAPPIQAMLAQQAEGQEPIPAAAQQQIAQLTQRLKELEQIAGQMNQALQTNAAEQEAKLQIEQLQADTKRQIAQAESQRAVALEQVRAQTELEKSRMDNATRIHVAEIAARTKGVVMAHEDEHEAVALAHDGIEAERDRQHEREMASRGLAHQAAMADGTADRAEMEAERARQATAAQAEADRQASAQGDGAGV